MTPRAAARFNLAIVAFLQVARGRREYHGPMSTTLRGKGTFEVKPTFEPPFDTRPGAKIGRATFEKVFQGPLSAESHVDMLSATSEVQGSAGYVALERIVGSIEGKQGSFVVQHSATMDRGVPSMTLTVVPDTATGTLTGLRGSMAIDVVEGEHFYTLDFTLPWTDKACRTALRRPVDSAELELGRLTPRGPDLPTKFPRSCPTRSRPRSRPRTRAGNCQSSCSSRTSASPRPACRDSYFPTRSSTCSGR